jgi:hypothetical protein
VIRKTVRSEGPPLTSGTRGTTALSSHIAIHAHFMRATNVEHHAGAEFAADYIPTPRGLEVIRRLCEASKSSAGAGRAWSLTGPYGAGKSSFAVFLASLFGRGTADETVAAMRVLRRADPNIARLVKSARKTLGAEDRGFIRAVVTAEQEPVVDTLFRAIESAVNRYYRGRVPKTISGALRDARGEATGRALCNALEAIYECAPVLIIIDEFGKNLEYFVTERRDADLYVLQQIAELTTGPDARPVFLLTLQHLAVDDYVREASTQQRREWGKVRGRFQDVPFLEAPEQSIRLVAEVLDDRRATNTFLALRSKWKRRAVAAARERGLGVEIPSFEQLMERCYPVHPVALLALPELCASLGQHGRTLFTFLASDEPHTLNQYLRVVHVGNGRMPTLTLDVIYDFFSEAVSGMGSTSMAAARWLEIDTRIREAAGLSDADRRLMKVVGLLNLVGRGDSLRASLPTLLFAVQSDLLTAIDDQHWRKRLEGLERGGFLTYRAFADEYRLWEGSDLDLAGAVRASRDRLRGVSAAELLNAMDLVPPVVAGRNSQEVGMLRYFDATFADLSGVVAAPSRSESPDGRIVYFLDQPARASELIIEDAHKPIVVATTTMSQSVIEAAIEVAASQDVLATEAIGRDRVARRELQEREAAARRRLRSALEAAYRPGSPDVAWTLRGSGPRSAAQGLSRMLSDICETVYKDSPNIRNEMLGRQELTSQGARARRELLTAMLERGEQARLGINGYGPERAMYEAFLHHTGVHRPCPAGSWAFGPPKAGNPLVKAWAAVESRLLGTVDEPVGADEIYATLVAAPFGVKEGPIPVLLTAILLAHAEDVAIFQDGTYQTHFTSDLVERLIKTPERFSIRYLAAKGSRARLIDALAGAVGAPQSSHRGRNRSLLRIVAPLVAAARGLPEYAIRTSTLSPDAAAVRAALVEARDPVDLIFSALPAALGVSPIRADSRTRIEALSDFVGRLTAALDELRGAFQRLRDQCGAMLADQLSRSGSIPQLRVELQARAQLIDSQVIEPQLRTFIHLVSDPTLDDESWVESMMLGLSGKPPSTWRDEDLGRFNTRLSEMVGTLSRVEALHFEAREHSTAGFDARRVVVTAPDGNEASAVVWVDHAVIPQVRAVAEDAVRRARELLGVRGPEALLALLANEVLPELVLPTSVESGEDEEIAMTLTRRVERER